ncbi:hypothetical protein BS50DRAFT_16889 [Corynespora cassiicola Philippines]|uniref:Uncharacterized protein n=1 Tax=Corynespora cassiicola Philippines TaxID=1448308 RepID=A0A2T2PA83_CORCC|nr:hypothetical protein BS50DRAFT_16889 [Corynespora cassiicola Philippines]
MATWAVREMPKACLTIQPTVLRTRLRIFKLYHPPQISILLPHPIQRSGIPNPHLQILSQIHYLFLEPPSQASTKKNATIKPRIQTRTLQPLPQPPGMHRRPDLAVDLHPKGAARRRYRGEQPSTPRFRNRRPRKGSDPDHRGMPPHTLRERDCPSRGPWEKVARVRV